MRIKNTDDTKNVTLELKLEIELDWLNFMIVKWIDTISYSEFIVEDIIIKIFYEKNERKIVVSKQNLELSELRTDINYKRISNKLNNMAELYLEKLMPLVFFKRDRIFNKNRLEKNYLIELSKIENIEIKKYNSLDEYFEDIENVFLRLDIPRMEMVPFIK